MLRKYRKAAEIVFVVVLLIYLMIRLSGQFISLEKWVSYALIPLGVMVLLSMMPLKFNKAKRDGITDVRAESFARVERIKTARVGERNKPNKELINKRENRMMNIIAAALPLLLIAYVLYMNLMPFGYSKTYALDVRGPNDCTKEMCIKSWTPAARNGTLKGEGVIVFRPLVGFSGARAYLKMDVVANSTVYVKKGDEWVIYWNPGWDKYNLLREFSLAAEEAKGLPGEFQAGERIKILVKPGYAGDAEGIGFSDWLERNRNESLYFYGMEFMNPENDELSYNLGPTIIDTALRGTHEFYVLLDGSLNLTVWKKDLNGYNGRDDLNVTLYALDGSVVYNELFMDDDDGNITLLDENNKSVLKQTDSVQVEEFYTQVYPGVYMLSLKGVKGTNRYEDFNIEKLLVNTDKIVARKHLLLANPGTIYTEGAVDINSAGTQKITVKGFDSKVLSIGANDTKKIKTFELAGGNALKIARGSTNVYSEDYIGFNSKNYFKPLKYEIRESPMYLIVADNGVGIDNGNVTIRSAGAEVGLVSIRLVK